MMKSAFISIIPSPYQVRFCNTINKYFDVDFLFCDAITEDRPDYWNIDLGIHCHVLKKKIKFGKGYYLNIDVFKELEKSNPDVIWLGGFPIITNLLAYYWGKYRNKKVVVFTEVSLHPNRLKFYRFLYSKVDAILTVGKIAEEQYKHHFPKTKIYNYSYGADIDERLSIKRDFDKEKVGFLYASRFIEKHNPLVLIEAFSRLREKYENVYMTMSSNGPLKKQCKEYVKELGIEDSVHFWDEFSSWQEVNQLYASCDILMFPASFSSWGLVIPEAMAAAMPIITTKEVLASELLDETCIVEPTCENLLESMEYYVLHPDEIHRQGLDNRSKSYSESFDEKAKKLKEIFEEVLNQEE